MDDEVEDFIRDNGVDELAANTLRDSAEDVQRLVMDRGDLKNARNPSSVLLARIKDAFAAPIMAGTQAAGYVRMRGLPFSATKDDIVKFFEDSHFNVVRDGIVLGMSKDGRSSGEAFVQFPSEEQADEAIKERNKADMGGRYVELFPSTAGEAARAAPSVSAAVNGHDVGGATRDEVDDFIRENGVDDKAADQLRDCDPGVQRRVIERGDMKNTRNPSSVLLSRIRSVQSEAFSQGSGDDRSRHHEEFRGQDRGDTWHGEDSFHGAGRPQDREDTREECGDFKRGKCTRGGDCRFSHDVGGRAEAPRGGASGGSGWPRDREDTREECGDFKRGKCTRGGDCRFSHDLGGRADAPQGGASGGSGWPGDREDTREECGDFKRGKCDRGGSCRFSHDLGGRAEAPQGGASGGSGWPRDREDTREECGDFKRGKCTRGDDCRFSHDIGGRAEAPQRDGGGGRQSSGHERRDDSSLDDEIEDFFRENGIDNMAQDTLKSCTPAVKEYCLERGDLKTARNPSSALLARIKEANSHLGVSPSCATMDVEEFIKMYGVDEKAADTFREATPSVQRSVMERGGLQNTRNPSSVLLARLREVSGASSGPALPARSRITGVLAEEVEGFIRGSDLDAKAADALRSCPTHIQEAVLDRGSLETARNPSSAVLARIRDAERAAGAGRPRDVDLGELLNDVQDFIRTNSVDESSAATLRSAVPGVQSTVIGRGSLASARNPSSVLLARIREAEKSQAESPGGGHGPAGGGRHGPASYGAYGGQDHGRDRVEDFLSSPEGRDIDNMAAETFRSCGPAIQEYVLEKGIAGARNPSSALLARVREAKSNLPGGGMGSDRGGGGYGGSPGPYGPGGYGAGPGGYGAAPGGYGATGYDNGPDYYAMGLAAGGQGYGTVGPASYGGPGQYGGCGGGYGGGGGYDAGYSGYGGMGLNERVERFLCSDEAQGVDDAACEALRNAEPEMQEFVIEKGIVGARNPSAVLLARMREGREHFGEMAHGGGYGGCGGKGGKGMQGGQGLNEMIHHFIMSEGIDDRAADALSSAAPAVQEYVLNTGIAGARNPSSAVLARMREAKTNVPGAGYGGPAAGYGPDFSAVEGFIRSSGIDERAAEHLRMSDPNVQGFVLDHGVTGARNPSSALIALIREAKMGGGEGKAGGKFGARGVPMGKSGAGKGNAAVDQFLRSNEIDAKGAEALRSAPRSVQDYVIEKGIKGARNPSSALLARIRDAKAAGGDAGKGRDKKRGRSRSRSRKRSRSRSSSSSSSSSSSTRRSRKKRRRRKRRRKSGSRKKSPSQKKLKPKPEKPKAKAPGLNSDI